MVIIVHHSQRFENIPAIPKMLTAYCQMGVQLFFVASAFTLCASYDIRSDEPHPLSSFFIRRIFRIAPLYYFGIGFYMVADLAMRHAGLVKGATNYTPLNVTANILFVHGFVPDAFNSVVPGGWSIATEMAFYALFPALFASFRWLHRRGGLPLIATVVAGALIVDAALQLAVIAWFGKGIANNNIFYCSIINQLPVFLIGMAGYAAIRYDDAFRPYPARDAIAFVVFTLVALWLMNGGESLPMIFLPSASAMAFLFMLNLARTFVHRAGVIEKVGQASFSMYVFHFVFALWITKIVVAALKAAVPVAALYVGTLALTILCTYGMATVSKLLIEDRFIDFGRRWIRKRDATRPEWTLS
jgi:peptidoglycan/LPS O-acetylase OafA/YrhL